MNNFELNSISVNDVLHTLRECERNGRYEGMFEHMLTFASELTGISVLAQVVARVLLDINAVNGNAAGFNIVDLQPAVLR